MSKTELDTHSNIENNVHPSEVKTNNTKNVIGNYKIGKETIIY
jgi:hypothetical protein